MSIVVKEKIIKLAYDFRNAIELIDNKDFPKELTLSSGKFPYFCCDETVELLGAFLQKNNIDNLNSYWGEQGGLKTEIMRHAWLQRCGLIIDITADQFIEYNFPKVLVTNKSEFHQSFKTINVKHCNYYYREKFKNKKFFSYKKAYSLILSKLL